MFSTDFLLPTDAINLDTSDAGSWSNMHYTYTDDETLYTSIRTPVSTDILLCNTYNFDTLPIDAFVLGIEVQVNTKAEFSDDKSENTIQLYQNKALIGNNKSTTAPILTTWDNRVYGGLGDFWGTNLTALDIKNSNLGVAVSFNSPNANDKEIKVNTIRIKIYYLTGTSPLSLSAF